MPIESKHFNGERPPHNYPIPMFALQDLNAWRDQNPAVKIISIESKVRFARATAPSDETVDQVFDQFVVWYEA